MLCVSTCHQGHTTDMLSDARWCPILCSMKMLYSFAEALACTSAYTKLSWCALWLALSS